VGDDDVGGARLAAAADRTGVRSRPDLVLDELGVG
jgi:hypothetical protein